MFNGKGSTKSSLLRKPGYISIGRSKNGNSWGLFTEGTFHFTISKQFQTRSDPDIRATHPLLRAAALHSGKDRSLWKCHARHLQLLAVSAKMFLSLTRKRLQAGTDLTRWHRKDDTQLPGFLPSCCWKAKYQGRPLSEQSSLKDEEEN